jgi:hypothetical protein
MLHPGVGGQDEVRGQQRAGRREPYAQVVDLGRQPVPAEDPQPEERGLQEEREQRLDRQRRAEDVPHQPRISRPVHAELEFLHDSCDDPDREVDQEEVAVELGQPQPALVPGAQPGGLEAGHEKPQADGDRNE